MQLLTSQLHTPNPQMQCPAGYLPARHQLQAGLDQMIYWWRSPQRWTLCTRRRLRQV